MLNKKSQRLLSLCSWVVIAAMLLSGCGGTQASKQYKVGILIGLGFASPIADGFKTGMKDLGYVEGKNITYDVQTTDFDMAKYESILKKFVADKVDLIVVTPTEATIEAKKLTQGTNIPVVFSFAFTEGMGLIDSVARPGGNVTGVRFPGVDITLKRYEVLHKIAPHAQRIWMPYQKGYPIVPPQIEALKVAATADGVTLIPFAANNAADLRKELDKRATSSDLGIDAILLLVEPLTVSPDAFAVIAKFAYDHDIPFGGAYDKSGEYTSVFGVNVDLFKSGNLAAPLARKIFEGTQAGMIPAVTPDNYFQLDYKAAQKFDLIIPDGVLKQADEIIR